jgi:excisionase family DNA binding protein
MPGLPAQEPPRPAPNGDDLLTLEAAAEICTVSYETFRRWVAKGVLPHVTVGPNKLKRVRRRDVDSLLRFVDRGD